MEDDTRLLSSKGWYVALQGDDLLVTILIEKLPFCPGVRKFLRPQDTSIRSSDIWGIVRSNVVQQRDMTTALQRLTEQFDVSRYIRTLTEDAAKSFLGHCTQYLSLYLPDCPFEIVETTKYGRAGEMAIRARKAISTGETINYLEGRMVPASEADIHDQQRQGQVVSVLESGRFRGAFVLSSLARFANHECHANSQLYRLSRTRLVIRAVRSIKVGDEVTVNYGEGYFGSGNADCRCTTCQRDDQEVRYDGGREGGDTIRCPLCHWDYVLTASTNVCPSCSRHFFLYGQFWPYSIPRDGYASEGLRSANL